MKALKITGVVFIALLGASIIVGAQETYRFDLRINLVAAPILSRINKWGDMTELTPKPFFIGQGRTEVVEVLQKAGFSRTPSDKVWKRYEAEILSGEELFEREANDLACRKQLYIFLRFDDSEKLISARGTQHEHGCP